MNATPAWAAEAAYALLEATTTEDVNSVLNQYAEFEVPKNWREYGDAHKNWDRVGVQTSEPVGALAEVLINSIDAILMRKAKENRINETSPNAPRDMREAVKCFFPRITEGRLSRLSARQQTQLAEQCVQVAIKRGKNLKKYPTYTIVDFGEGQNPEQFPNTLLSLSAKNKEGIPFVQGRFNMGSTGSITFCTRADIRNGLYKFILSKRTLADSDGRWGWTLIRVRPAREDEALPVVEYFAPDRRVPAFKASRIEAFGQKNIGILDDGGTVVKLYEYDIGPRARAVDLGLHNTLTTSLIHLALPIRLIDFDAAPQDKGAARAEGIAARTFSGMSIILDSDEEANSKNKKTLDFSRLIAQNSDNPALGTIRIHGLGISKMPDHLLQYPYRVFYTINGQTQAKERASFFRRANLDDLRNHLIVQVDCNGMNNTARSGIFKPDRERKTDNEMTRELDKIILESLRADSALREYAAEIRKRRVTEKVEEDETSKEFFRDLIKHSPELKDLFGMGGVVDDVTQKPGGASDFKGREFPTFLEPIGLDSDGLKIVPINAARKIECNTDAENDYLSRNNDPGEFIHPSADELPHNLSGLRNGKLRITLRIPTGAKVGDEIPCTFGFRDSSPRPEPLTFSVLVRVGEAEPTSSKPKGRQSKVKSTPDNSLAFPDIEWVYKGGWGEFNFNEESGACIIENPEGVTIYVNGDNRHLIAMNARERDESERDMCRHMFRYGVGILTLAMHKRLNDKMGSDADTTGDADTAVKHASEAISAHVVNIIRQLGGRKLRS